MHVDGLKGYGFTATRLDVHGVVDAVVVHGPGTTVTAAWLHDLRHYAVDPGQGGGPSHDDGVQVQAGTGIRLIGNVIDGGANSALQVTQDVGVTSDLELTGNWLDGGACTVNVAEKGRGPIEGLVVSDNLFGRRSSVPGCAATVPTSTPLVADDNRYDDGQPVTIRRD
ncbi:hypothetical protein GCM10025868_22970 [Angustibacter aerolatus]|uniref:Right handed beta helix domain-containing protein n=1 Tax=Angustibacter aerolatus TaxID=1162965 RepID=A0ABQ6JJJ8_9ACTN|nr:hypothetical protein [Angustibacter aerolatus]GMA87047.1 hypothetical protein GCM10025868_22970 [Angustibacter aerolatus]